MIVTTLALTAFALPAPQDPGKVARRPSPQARQREVEARLTRELTRLEGRFRVRNVKGIRRAKPVKDADRAAAARLVLKRCEKDLHSGIGLYYQGRLLQFANRKKAATKAFAAFAATDTAITPDARLFHASVARKQNNIGRARDLMRDLEPKKVSREHRRLLASMEEWYHTTVRDERTKNKLPTFAFEHWLGLGAPKENKVFQKKKDSVTVLFFLHHTAGICRDSIARLQRMLEERNPGNLEVVGLTILRGEAVTYPDDEEEVTADNGKVRRKLDAKAELELLEKGLIERIDFPVLIIPAALQRKMFGIRTFPTFVVIGKDGKVRTYVYGTAFRQLSDEILAALK